MYTHTQKKTKNNTGQLLVSVGLVASFIFSIILKAHSKHLQTGSGQISAVKKDTRFIK